MGGCCSGQTIKKIEEKYEVSNSLNPIIEVNENNQSNKISNTNTINSNRRNNNKRRIASSQDNQQQSVISGDINTTERDLLPINQRHAESLIEYINDIRVYPNKYIEKAKNKGVIDIINSLINSKINPGRFPKNRFYNSLLESYVKRSPDFDEGVLRNLEENIHIKKFKKLFFVTKAGVQEPNEAVWNLLIENKNKIINDIFLANITFLVLCVFPIPNTPQLKVYFLFLKSE